MLNWFDRGHPLAGGAETFLHEVFGRLARAGHDVILLCCPFAGGSRNAELDGIHVRRRGEFWTLHVQMPFIYAREFARQPFDLVFDFTNKVPFAAPWWVHRPVIAVAHHLFGRTIFAEAAPLVATYIYAMERLLPVLYPRTPFLAVSQSTRQDLIRRGIDSSRITVIHNGVDHRQFVPAPGMREERPTLLYLGRIRRYKRLDLLLDATHILADERPEVQLWVAGDGPDLPRLRRYAGQIGIADRTTFYGWVSAGQKVALLQRATLMVQPSLKEGWGLTAVEANACGTPVVAADVPGLRDSVKHDETGLLVPPGNAEALAAAVRALLADSAKRDRLAANARTWAQRFSWDIAAQQTLALAHRALRSAR